MRERRRIPRRTARPPEIHLFAIWEKGRGQADRIIADIQEHFEVLAGFEVRWTDDQALRPFNRLYGQSLPPGCDKVRECGTGPFLLLVVEDPAPRYGRRRKWGDVTITNTNLFDAKARYREWTDGSRVHNSSDEDETDRDLFVLLGRRREEFRQMPRGRWDGSFEAVERDPLGTHGWTSRADLFTAIELTLPYVVLGDVNGDGRTIRMLVNVATDDWGVEWLIAAPEDEPLASRAPVYPFLLDRQEHLLELSHIGDGTHPSSWQEAMLHDRVRDPSGTFVLPPSHAFYDLLHATLQQSARPSVDQASRLAEAARRAGAPVVDFTDVAAAREVLDAFLERHTNAGEPRGERVASRGLTRRLVDAALRLGR